MSSTPDLETQRKIPSPKDAIIFRFKSALLQARRGARNLLDPKIRKFSKAEALLDNPVIAESKTALWTESDPEERFLLAGKIHNLRLVIRELDGIEIPAGEIFSFWKQTGRTRRMRGFVAGRELREGCIIPNIGGGLCQISNALYDAALKANFEVVERHAHTQVVAGSLAEQGRDATVFWNYVDLRFCSPEAFRIEARLDAENLVLRFKGKKTERKQLFQISRHGNSDHGPNSCATCGEESCFRMVKPAASADFGKTAYLVDEYTPEFDTYIQGARKENDTLFLPLDGRRFGKANYAWTTGGFSDVKQKPVVAAVRSYRSRKLAAQGAARQKNLLDMYEKLADAYARNLSFDVLHVVVHQNLLPFLWKAGHLGGRTFDVLMSAMPMEEIQRRLDKAAALHPESKTLGDFRADGTLLKAETEALEQARTIITQHTGIAALYPGKAEIIGWKLPKGRPRGAVRNSKPTILFPASTVGRKGCYELREALRGLNFKLVTMGPDIEGGDFWEGFDRERGRPEWLETADLVVLPAFVEHRPRRLLEAAAAGIPVIASEACGVENVNGIETIEAGDAIELRERILICLAGNAALV
jgi:glycosyltransferase involved in cell wall biosynthesis